MKFTKGFIVGLFVAIAMSAFAAIIWPSGGGLIGTFQNGFLWGNAKTLDFNQSPPEWKDENGVQQAIRQNLERDVLTNSSFEESYSASPALGWTYTPSGSDVVEVETTEIMPGNGAQAAKITPSAETFTFDQTFSSDQYLGNLIGFTAWVKSDQDFEICFLSATTESGCVEYDTSKENGEYRKILVLGDPISGQASGIRFKSDSSITGTIYFDGVEFTSEPLKFEEVATNENWISYTPTINNFGTITNLVAKYRRVGDSLQASIWFNSGVPTASVAEIFLPSGLLVDSSKLPDSSNNRNRIGSLQRVEAGQPHQAQIWVMHSDPTITDRVFVGVTPGANTAFDKEPGNQIVANTDGVSINFTVPIAGWAASNNTVLVPVSNNLSDWISYSPTSQGLGTLSNVELRYRRVGDSAEILGCYTTGTTTAVEGQLGLPPGLTISSTKMPILTKVGKLVSDRQIGNGLSVLATGGDTYLNFADENSAGGGLTVQTGVNTHVPSQKVCINATVPIQGWDSVSEILVNVPTVENIVSEWQPFTPVWSAGFGTVTENSGRWRRNGDTFEAEVSARSGTTAASVGFIELPFGLLIDTNKISKTNTTAGNGPKIGVYDGAGNSQSQDGNILAATDTDQGKVYFGPVQNVVTDKLGISSSVTASVMGVNTRMVARFAVPIQGWATEGEVLAVRASSKVCFIKDVKPNNTAGGTCTSGSWQTRDLNTLEGDCDGVSLSSNAFTLEDDSKWILEGITHGASVLNAHQSRIRNTTDSTTAIVGTSAHSGGGDDMSETKTMGILELTDSKTFELQHRCTSTVATIGFGRANNFGEAEVYSQIKLTRKR